MTDSRHVRVWWKKSSSRLAALHGSNGPWLKNRSKVVNGHCKNNRVMPCDTAKGSNGLHTTTVCEKSTWLGSIKSLDALQHCDAAMDHGRRFYGNNGPQLRFPRQQ
eukprot:1158433-Pelagomonas_calceolata.AAC.1